MSDGAYLLELGLVPYGEAFELQRSLAGSVSNRKFVFSNQLVNAAGGWLITSNAAVGANGNPLVYFTGAEGGASTNAGTIRMVQVSGTSGSKRRGKDVKRYVRDLEEALIGTLGAFGLEGERIAGLTGMWMTRPPRKIASIGVHVSRWVTTHGYALNVDLDPAPFTDWITACGLEDAQFTTIARELGRPVDVEEVRPAAAAAVADVFELEFEALPADDGVGLWRQPIHAQLSAR